jgi:hypothetical protein
MVRRRVLALKSRSLDGFGCFGSSGGSGTSGGFGFLGRLGRGTRSFGRGTLRNRARRRSLPSSVLLPASLEV